MADENHLKIIKQGVAAWNEWRKANPEIKPDLRGADLSLLEKFEYGEVRGGDYSGADFSSANLREVNLNGSNLLWTDFQGASLLEAYLDSADFSKADLRRAELTRANLNQANLNEADLSAAKIDGASFRRAKLCGSILAQAIVFDADFQEADLTGANLSGCRMGWVRLAGVDLSRCKGLDTVKHLGPSSIDIDSIRLSGGNIPEAFLRGVGVPVPFIANMKSLLAVESPLDFYSCFISYSSKDQDFAERLHADLRSKGVRCWFAPEDLKIGDKLRPSFDEAIHVHDKLLVVVSESSVKSVWVEKEVETAFEIERQQNRTVLFPIRLDDSVTKTKQAWAADIRRTRHIGDFRGWKNHDSYQKAFDRLLRDLRAADRAVAQT